MALTVHTPSNVKTIPGFPNYAITRDGRVWSKPYKRFQRGGGCSTGKFLKSAILNNGRLQVTLYQNGGIFYRQLSRLVLETYISPCPQRMECRHLNGKHQDNHIDNLCWGTSKENAMDRNLHGTTARGERNGFSTLIKEQVKVIFHTYHDGAATQQELADAFEISRGHVANIVNKKVWKHLWN